MFKKFLLMTFLAFFISSDLFAAGIAVESTRVIYDGESSEASTSIRSTGGHMTYLVQAWVEGENPKEKPPFIVTPPVSKLEPGAKNMLRIVRVGGNIPDDKESVYWLNFKAIPPKPADEEANVLQIAIKTRLKLFYRPPSLKGKKPEDSPAKLVWTLNNNDILIENPTIFSVTIAHATIGEKEFKNIDLVPAKGSLKIEATGVKKGQSIQFVSINDYGGHTQPISTLLN